MDDGNLLFFYFLAIYIGAPGLFFVLLSAITPNNSSAGKFGKYLLAIAFVLCLIPPIGGFFIKNHFTLTRESTKLYLSLLSLWLAGIGIIGRDRLDKWGKIIQAVINDSNRLKEGEKLYYSCVIILFGICLVVGVIITIVVIFSGGGKVFSQWLNIFIPLCVLFLILLAVPIPYAFSLLFFFITIPFRLMSFLEQKEALERSFIFIGILLGSVVLFFLD